MSDDVIQVAAPLANVWQDLLAKQKELGLVDKGFVLKVEKVEADGSIDPDCLLDWNFELVKSFDEMAKQVLKLY